MASSLKNLSDYDPASVPAAGGLKFGIVISEWNKQITLQLAEAAVKTLIGSGASLQDVFIEWVPGSFELPLGGQLLIEERHPDALILIGCVIRGETPHFDYICQAVSKGCMDIGLKYNLPAIFGVLTTNNLEEALDRSGGKHGNKGTEAAITAIKMASLRIRSSGNQ